MLFVTIGFVMSVAGIAIGLLVGTGLALALPWLFAQITTALDAQLMSQYFISYLPSEIRPADMVAVASISLFLAMLATLFPAWRGARLLPSEVLNHE